MTKISSLLKMFEYKKHKAGLMNNNAHLLMKKKKKKKNESKQN